MMQERGKLAAEREPGSTFRGHSSTFTARDLVIIICLAGAIREIVSIRWLEVVLSLGSFWWWWSEGSWQRRRTTRCVTYDIASRQTHPFVLRAHWEPFCLLKFTLADSCYSDPTSEVAGQ